MERLRDQTSSADPVTARAAALLSAMPPLDSERLRRLPPLAEDAANRRTRVRRIGTIVVLAITMGSVAAGAATVRRRVGWLAARRWAFQSAAAPMPSASVESRPAAPGGAAAAADVPPAAPAVAVDADSKGPIAPGAVPRAPAASLGARSVPTHTAKDRSRDAVGATDDESALVVEAVRALRRDGDPARAQSLAEEDLRRHPHGAQVEEAMALSMEAAFARGDLPGARRAAERYIASFRTGRFADRAQRILAASPR